MKERERKGEREGISDNHPTEKASYNPSGALQSSGHLNTMSPEKGNQATMILCVSHQQRATPGE